MALDKKDFILGILLGIAFTFLLISFIVSHLIDEFSEERTILNDCEVRYINYINLNESEIRVFENILSELSPDFLVLGEKIIVGKGIKKIDNYTIRVNDTYSYTNDLLGLNVGNGEEIYIRYTGNYCGMKKTLCHEFLHSLLRVENEEYYVELMEDSYLCYKNKKC